MERLKSLDFKICFDTTFVAPLSIKLDSKKKYLTQGKTFLPLTVSTIDQRVDIEFDGYVPHDKIQKIIVDIYYADTKLDTLSLCTFQMMNNQYIDNVLLKDYNEICFNGTLTLQFFKSWFECNLLAGCSINYRKTDYIHRILSYQNNSIDRNRVKALKKYNTICLGASTTHGTDQLSPINAWPGQLQKMLKAYVGNFGLLGADHFTIMHNIEYTINNFDVKRIIALLPNNFILPTRVSFLGNYVFLFRGLGIQKVYLPFKLQGKAWEKKNILKENYIKKFLSNKLKKIENICAERNIELYLIHDSYETRDEFNYSGINLQNFTFPKWNKFNSLEDGHPDETVHSKFAKQVIEMVKKKGS